MAIRTRADKKTGKTLLVVDIRYRGPDGRRERYRRDAQVQTRAAAIAEERRLLGVLAATGTIPTGAEPVSTAVEPARVEAGTWDDAVENYRRLGLPKVKPSTRKGYEEILASPSLSRWQGLQLDEIASRWSAWDAEIVSSGVSASRRRNLHVVARSVLRAAADAGQLADMPKLGKLPKVGRTVVQAVNEEDLRRILDEPDNVKGVGPALTAARQSARLAMCLAAYAGLRSGEVRALRWRDVDLRRRTITVRVAISGGEEAPPKSGSEREIPINALLYSRLAIAAERARAASKRSEKQGPPPDGLVATKADGTAWGPAGILRALVRACARLEIDGRRFHALRHYFVTQLFAKGAPAPVVQALAGHHSLAVTQRYAHHTAEAKRAAVAALTA